MMMMLMLMIALRHIPFPIQIRNRKIENRLLVSIQSKWNGMEMDRLLYMFVSIQMKYEVIIIFRKLLIVTNMLIKY